MCIRDRYWIYGEDAELAARLTSYLTRVVYNQRANYIRALMKIKKVIAVIAGIAVALSAAVGGVYGYKSYQDKKPVSYTHLQASGESAALKGSSVERLSS